MTHNSEKCIEIASGKLWLRVLDTIEDAREVVHLQQEIWGYGQSGADFPYPARALLAISRSGGHVVLACSDGVAVGFSLAWPGLNLKTQETYLHSQLMGVRKAFRYSKIGQELKLFQRDFALRQNIKLIRWTFDPMRSVNAHLNLQKLGVLVTDFEHDYYGSITNKINNGLATDRLWAEWHITSERVQSHLKKPIVEMFQEYLFTELTTVKQDAFGYPYLSDFILEERLSEYCVQIPTEFESILNTNRELALDWQEKVRQIFQYYLNSGYVISDFFVRTGPPHQAFYVISHQPLEVLLRKR